jgi:hypothetical protein
MYRLRRTTAGKLIISINAYSVITSEGDAMKNIFISIALLLAGSVANAQIPVPAPNTVNVVSESDINLETNQVGRLRDDKCTYAVSTRKVDGDNSFLAKLFDVDTFVLDINSALCGDTLVPMTNATIQLIKPIKAGDKISIPSYGMTEIISAKIANYMKTEKTNEIIEKNNFVTEGMSVINLDVIYRYCHADKACFSEMVNAANHYLKHESCDDSCIDKAFSETQKITSVK